jgi:hypothetical protein
MQLFPESFIMPITQPKNIYRNIKIFNIYYGKLTFGNQKKQKTKKTMQAKEEENRNFKEEKSNIYLGITDNRNCSKDFKILMTLH